MLYCKVGNWDIGKCGKYYKVGIRKMDISPSYTFHKINNIVLDSSKTGQALFSYSNLGSFPFLQKRLVYKLVKNAFKKI